MPQPSDSLELIVRFLDQPNDPGLLQEIGDFRTFSEENEQYFSEIQKLWQQSAASGRLKEISVQQAVENLKEKLAPRTRLGSTRSYWVGGIAAAVLACVFGIWLSVRNSEPKYILRSTAKNQIDSVKLSDGSVIILAGNTTLKYQEHLDPAKREVSLIKGKAFFKIVHDPKHTFKVELNQSYVTVLGTSFNIKLTEKMVELSVKTGKVVFSTYEDGATSVLLAGQALSYDIDKKELLTRTAQNQDAWLTKELVFVDTPLEEVCKQLTEYYEVDIQLDDSKHLAKKLNANFSDQSLDNVLLILNETYNIKIKKVNNRIHLITH